MSDFLLGLSMVSNLYTVLWCAFGSVLGIILGALPGLTATMGIALVIPISWRQLQESAFSFPCTVELYAEHQFQQYCWEFLETLTPSPL